MTDVITIQIIPLTSKLLMDAQPSQWKSIRIPGRIQTKAHLYSVLSKPIKSKHFSNPPLFHQDGLPDIIKANQFHKFTSSPISDPFIQSRTQFRLPSIHPEIVQTELEIMPNSHYFESVALLDRCNSIHTREYALHVEDWETEEPNIAQRLSILNSAKSLSNGHLICIKYSADSNQQIIPMQVLARSPTLLHILSKSGNPLLT